MLPFRLIIPKAPGALRLLYGNVVETPNCGSFHLVNDCFIGGAGFNGQLFGKQKVAAVALGDLDHIAARA